MSKISIENLIRAIIINRASDDCGPGCPSRNEATMIIKREWKARDAVIEAAQEVAEMLAEWTIKCPTVTSSDVRDIGLGDAVVSLSKQAQALADLEAVQDA